MAKKVRAVRVMACYEMSFGAGGGGSNIVAGHHFATLRSFTQPDINWLIGQLTEHVHRQVHQATRTLPGAVQFGPLTMRSLIKLDDEVYLDDDTPELPMPDAAPEHNGTKA